MEKWNSTWILVELLLAALFSCFSFKLSSTLHYRILEVFIIFFLCWNCEHLHFSLRIDVVFLLIEVAPVTAYGFLSSLLALESENRKEALIRFQKMGISPPF